MATLTATPPPGRRSTRDAVGDDRPLPITRRRDLIAVNHEYNGVRYWVVKDPISLKYYRFPEEEYAILQMLDGGVSMRGLTQKFNERFSPQKIESRMLHGFLGRLHERGLVVIDAAGQAESLLRRERDVRRRERVLRYTNILSIRFPGIDPERLLAWLNGVFGWVFSPITAFAFALLGAAALMLLVTNFETFLLRLPSLEAFFAAENLLPYAAAMIACKVCHEFGHGLAAKRFGGECHRMGFMLLVFMPAMYCDVSDSWLLASKWRRIAIAAAGVYIELILAALATFVWWFTEPGIINSLALGVMVSSSVSTLLVNMNPLMRFDGYYALSDLLEVPNLASRSREELQRVFSKLCLGIKAGRERKETRQTQACLIVYGVSSLAYRLLLVCLINYALYSWLAPAGLGIVANLLLAQSLFLVLGMPLMRCCMFLSTPGRMRTINRRKACYTSAVVLMVGAILFLVPLPRSVRCEVLLDLQDSHLVYADPGGRIEELFVGLGDSVQPGAPILRLSNNRLDLSIAELQTKKNVAVAALDSVKKAQFASDEASHSVATHRDRIKQFDDLLEHRLEQRSRLVVRSPVSGRVLASPSANRPANRLKEPMADRVHNLLDDENIGATLLPGERICQIGDPSTLKATIFVDQSDCGELHGGQRVRLKMHSLPLRTFTARLDDVAIEGEPSEGSARMPKWDLQLSSAPPGAHGVANPRVIAFRATAEIDNRDGLLRPGMLGKGKIEVGYRTIASRVWKLICTHVHL